MHQIAVCAAPVTFWDVAWLVVFGLVPFFFGWRGRSKGGGSMGSGHAAIGLLIVVLGGAAAANLFPLRGDNGTTVVALRPNVSAAGLLQALDGTDARIVWTDRAGGVWVLRNLSFRQSFALYGSGALYVSGTTAPAGCSVWLQTTSKRPAFSTQPQAAPI